MEPSPNVSAAQQAYAWQDQRRRKDGRFDCPIAGFGGDGTYTLWVPSPVAYRRYTFDSQGEPRVEIGGGCVAEDPQLQAMRDQIIRSLASTGPGLMTVDLAFLKYAAQVLKRNYELSGEDLTMLLVGSAWHDAMLRHLIGGDEFVEAVLVHGQSLVEQIRPARTPPVSPIPQEEYRPIAPARSSPSEPKRRWWEFWK